MLCRAATWLEFPLTANNTGWLLCPASYQLLSRSCTATTRGGSDSAGNKNTMAEMIAIHKVIKWATQAFPTEVPASRPRFLYTPEEQKAKSPAFQRTPAVCLQFSRCSSSLV